MTFGAFAQELRVGAGIADYQVLQRDPQGVARVKIGGTADKLAGKTIEARLASAGKPVRNFGWRTVGTINGATWTAEINGVPTGGPYDLELRAAGAPTVVVHNLLVGDLWVLAGQSNMEGVGNLVDLQQPDPRVHSFDMSDVWGVAKEPLHELASAADRVHWRRSPGSEPRRLEGEELAKYREGRRKGAGLGLPFAVEMVRRTGVPVGLIPCAHGGTSMAQWDPALRDKGGDSLYGSMYRRVQTAGGRVKGVLWYQGESDANPKTAPLFQKNFEGFIEAVRRDFNAPDLPFYYIQLGRHINTSNQDEWNAVQEVQRTTAERLQSTGVVGAVDLTLDDGIHISTSGLKLLGVRLANVASGVATPRPVSAEHRDGVIRIRFDGVNHRLQSDGRIGGFTLHNESGGAVSVIYKAEVDPTDGSAVLLHVQGKLPSGATLRYGAGKDPYANLRDGAGMAVPVFGPMPVRQ
jgi:sialate O-acetylesterase